MRRILAVAAGAAVWAEPAWASEAGKSFLGIPHAIWLPLNLAGFLFLLYWFVGRPLGRFLETRREGIAGELEEARRKLAEAEDLRAEVLKRLDEVEHEVAEMRTRAEREGDTEAAKIAAQAEADEARFLKRVEDEIARRQAETRELLAQETAALTAQLTRELLSTEMTDADRKRVLQRSLEAMQTLSEEG